MDLRRYRPRPELLAELETYCHYQPFILSDDVETGVAEQWIHGSSDGVLHRDRVTPERWERFTSCNARLRRMYDAWIGAACAALGDMAGVSVADVGCHAGYFAFRLLERGAASATGYDRAPEMARSFALLNEITGLGARFENRPYDMWRHRIVGAEPVDLVISSALMCHLSDPTYHLAYVGSLARRAVLLFSAVTSEPGFRVTYEGARYHVQDPYPTCFDLMTRVSRPLVDFAFAEMGFALVEIPHEEDWLPWSWYEGFQALLAVRR